MNLKFFIFSTLVIVNIVYSSEKEDFVTNNQSQVQTQIREECEEYFIDIKILYQDLKLRKENLKILYGINNRSSSEYTAALLEDKKYQHILKETDLLCEKINNYRWKSCSDLPLAANTTGTSISTHQNSPDLSNAK